MAYCSLILRLLQFHQDQYFTKISSRKELMAKTRNFPPKDRKAHRKTNRLPLYLALGGGVILIVAALLAFQKPRAPYTPEVTGRASLKADKELVDLGEVKLGTQVEVTFNIENVGDQPLVFSEPPYIEVKEGC